MYKQLRPLSTASRKRTVKMAQFIPDASSLGIDEGRVSEREVGAVDIGMSSLIWGKQMYNEF